MHIYINTQINTQQHDVTLQSSILSTFAGCIRLSHLEIHVLAVEGGVLGVGGLSLAIATLAVLGRPAGVEPYRIYIILIIILILEQGNGADTFCRRWIEDDSIHLDGLSLLR